MSKNVDLVFDNVFKEYYGKNKLLFDNYQKYMIYQLLKVNVLSRKNYINIACKKNILYYY